MPSLITSRSGKVKGRHSEPCLNFKSRLLTSFCRLAQFSPRRKFVELPFADEKFELVSRRRSLSAAPFRANPFSPPLSCHRRGLHRIFMSPRAPFLLPHIYATTAQPDTDLARKTFSTLTSPAKDPLNVNVFLYKNGYLTQTQFQEKNDKVLLILSIDALNLAYFSK